MSQVGDINVMLKISSCGVGDKRSLPPAPTSTRKAASYSINFDGDKEMCLGEKLNGDSVPRM